MSFPIFENGVLSLEFLYSELRLSRDQDSDDVVEAIYNHVIDNYHHLESEITAVQFWPNKRFPKKVYLFFSSQRAKDVVHQRGMSLLGTHINFDEPGQGLMRIEVQNVLHSVPNHVISRWLSQFGEVVDVKHDYHKFKSGRKITWGTGVRFGWIKHVHSKIPPYAAVEHNGRTLHMNIWYFGITEMHCRFCRLIVEKNHVCTKAPRKRCNKCNSENHLQHECTVGKVCYKCQCAGHLSKDCPLNDQNQKKSSTLGAAMAQTSGTSNTSYTNQTSVKSPTSLAAMKQPLITDQFSRDSNDTRLSMNPFTGEKYSISSQQDTGLTVNNKNFPRLSDHSDSEQDEPLPQRVKRSKSRKHSRSSKDAPEGETGITQSILEAKHAANKIMQAQNAGEIEEVSVHNKITSPDSNKVEDPLNLQEKVSTTGENIATCASFPDKAKSRLLTLGEEDDDAYLSAPEFGDMENKMSGLKIETSTRMEDEVKTSSNNEEQHKEVSRKRRKDDKGWMRMNTQGNEWTSLVTMPDTHSKKKQEETEEVKKDEEMEISNVEGDKSEDAKENEDEAIEIDEKEAEVDDEGDINEREAEADDEGDIDDEKKAETDEEGDIDEKEAEADDEGESHEDDNDSSCTDDEGKKGKEPERKEVVDEEEEAINKNKEDQSDITDSVEEDLSSDNPDIIDMPRYTDSEEEEKPELNLILLGTSNFSKIDLFLRGDETLTLNTKNLYHGGSKIMNSNYALAHRLENVDRATKEAAHYVVMHGGNLDLPIKNEDEMNTLIDRYELEIHTVKEECFNSTIIISSAPPRCGPGREGINDMLAGMNRRLEGISEFDDKVLYANNYRHLTHNGADDGNVLAGFYVPHDKSGIHLNDEGQHEMAKAIMKEIHLDYFATNPRKEVVIS